MKDYILRATAADGAIRAFMATSKETVKTAQKMHGTSPIATVALGRLLVASAIIGTTLKNEKDLITLQIKGDGELKGVIATSDCKARVKGYVFNPDYEVTEEYPKGLSVGSAIGKGFLTIIKDIGLKEPYSGQIELVSGEIAEDLTHYYYKSEQIPSAIGLGVLIDTDLSVRQAGGFMIQLMPGASDSVIDALEEKIARMPNITDLYDMGRTPEDVLNMILGDMGVEITDKIPMEFYCNCDRERVERALISVGAKDLAKIIDEDKKANLKCHFCNESYDFNEKELIELLEEALKK